jgi:hypothetical protein
MAIIGAADDDVTERIQLSTITFGTRSRFRIKSS